MILIVSFSEGSPVLIKLTLTTKGSLGTNFKILGSHIVDWLTSFESNHAFESPDLS